MSRPDRHRLAWLCACIVLAVLPYVPGLRNGFAWLDHSEILDGKLIVRSPSELLALLGNDRNFAGYHRPLYNLAHSLDLWLWGPQPFGFHLSSLILHGLNVGLVFALAVRLGWASAAAALLGALWGLHPINAEVAGLVHAKADLLVVSLALGSLLLLVEGLRRERACAWLAASLVLYALALLAKELAYVYPLALAAWWLARRRLAPAPPAGYLVAVAVLTALGLLHRWMVVESGAYASPLGLPERLATFGAVYVVYLRKLLVPGQLFIADTTTRFSALGGGKLLVLVFLGIAWTALACLWRARPWTRKWIVLFHLALLPVCQLVPVLHFQAERYLYLPSLAFCGALAEACARACSASARARWGLAPAVVGLLALLAWLDLARVRTFRDDFTLFTPEVERQPGYREGLSMLARAHDRAGNPELAGRLYEAALAPRPQELSFLDLEGTAVNLTANLLARDRPADVRAAAARFGAHLRSPRHAEELAYNVAVADYRLGRFAEALPVLSPYARRHPLDASAAYLAGMSAHRCGDARLARAHLGAYLELRPDARDTAQVREVLAALGE